MEVTDSSKRIQKAVKTTLVTQLFGIGGLVLSFVTVPLYLVWLGPHRYGLMLTALSCASYLMLTDAGLSWASMILIAHEDGRKDHQAISKVFRHSIMLAATSALLGLLISFSAYFLLRNVASANINPEIPGLALAVGLQVATSLLFSSFYNLFIGLQAGYWAGVYQGIARLLGPLFSLGVASGGGSLSEIIMANVVVSIVIGIACALHAIKRYPWAFVKGGFFDRGQVRLQLRTGAKSFGLQIGRTLTGNAPVLIISSMAGAAFVPLYTVPTTLLNSATGILWSYSASLQPGFGEAWGQNDRGWIIRTLHGLLKQNLIILGLCLPLFLVLGSSFISLWTSHKLLVPLPMLISVALIGSINVLLSPLQFVLTGINHHKVAAKSELLRGLLTPIIGGAIVYLIGVSWIGLGVLLTAAATSFYFILKELRVIFGDENFLPSFSYAAKVLISFSSGLGVAYLFKTILEAQLPQLPWPVISISGFAGATAFLISAITLRLLNLRSLLARLSPLTSIIKS